MEAFSPQTSRRPRPQTTTGPPESSGGWAGAKVGPPRVAQRLEIGFESRLESRQFLSGECVPDIWFWKKRKEKPVDVKLDLT